MPFDPDWVIPPGETLRDWFEEIGLPYAVAERYGISQRTLGRLLDGKQKITPALAQKLCNLTHVGAPFWLALEHNYRVGLAAGKTVVRSNSGTRRVRS
jgi:HTH-type transcriptional regulator/antitoxin HigA